MEMNSNSIYAKAIGILVKSKKKSNLRETIDHLMDFTTDFKWISKRFTMDFAFMSSVFLRDFKGLYIYFKRISNGFQMDSLLISRGFPMESQWISNWFPMFFQCISNGFQNPEKKNPNVPDVSDPEPSDSGSVAQWFRISIWNPFEIHSKSFFKVNWHYIDDRFEIHRVSIRNPLEIDWKAIRSPS